jgi:S-formylglutathione hydrolase FrmB
MAFIQCDFFSQVLRKACSMNVILPDPGSAGLVGMESVGGASADGHPVLWLLHGLSDNHTTWMRRTSIERYAAARGLAVVMPDAGRGFYLDHADGPAWGGFFEEELPAVARSFFPLAADRARNFVAGLSMGGYGTFRLALARPERYAAAASLSGTLDVAVTVPERFAEKGLDGEARRVFGDFHALAGTRADLLHLVREASDGATALPDLFASCGTGDELLESNRKFRAAASAAGVALTYEERPGGHTWDFWDREIRRVLQWLSEKGHLPEPPAAD